MQETVTCPPRVYPFGFGDALRDIMTSWQAQPHLRQKKPVDTSLSDRELFCSMALGDLWPDAKLVEVYRYIRQSRKTHVPPSWVTVFEELDVELDKVQSSLS